MSEFGHSTSMAIHRRTLGGKKVASFVRPEFSWIYVDKRVSSNALETNGVWRFVH